MPENLESLEQKLLRLIELLREFSSLLENIKSGKEARGIDLIFRQIRSFPEQLRGSFKDFLSKEDEARILNFVDKLKYITPEMDLDTVIDQINWIRSELEYSVVIKPRIEEFERAKDLEIEILYNKNELNSLVAEFHKKISDIFDSAISSGKTSQRLREKIREIKNAVEKLVQDDTIDIRVKIERLTELNKRIDSIFREKREINIETRAAESKVRELSNSIRDKLFSAIREVFEAENIDFSKIRELRALEQELRSINLSDIEPEIKAEKLEELNRKIDSILSGENKVEIQLDVSTEDVSAKVEQTKSELEDLFKSPLEQVAEKFPGLIDFIKQEVERLGLDLDDVLNSKVNLRELKDNITKINIKDFGPIYYSRDLNKFSRDLRELQRELEAIANKKNLENLFRDFDGLKSYLENIGVEVDKLSSKFKVFIADAEKGIQGIRFSEGFSVFIDKSGRISSSLKELRNALSAEQLEQIKNRFSDVIREAERLGYSLENLKKVEEIGNGVTRFSFTMKDASGVTRRLILYSDQLGNVLVDNQKRFLNFTDAIIRNTLEAARWAAAVTIVYGGLRKLNEAIDEAIKNQERLASIAVIIGTNSKYFNQLFDSARKVADELGIPVGDVLEGYTTAFRVAGAEAENLSERTAKASALLKDALVLSKLTGEEAARSIDLLVSTIRQMNGELEDSTKIIDSWVFLSRHAAVTVLDLAEAFSISSATAKTAGVDFEELSGIIAALSESTPYTGEEIGNILKSLFSNIQSDRAAQELQKFGITVRDLQTGELRDFNEILFEIQQKFKSGLISESDLAVIGRAVGGGARRGPQFVTLIKSLDEANRYTALLKDTNIELGYSYSAVEVKTATVQSNLNRLSNAFQKLAITLGDSGGVLAAINNLVVASTTLLNITNSLINIFGEQGIGLVLTFMISRFSKSAYSLMFFRRVLESVIRAKQQLVSVTRQQVAAESQAIRVTDAEAYALQNKVLAGLAVASTAMLSDNWTQAATTIVGGLAGFFIGGGPIGAGLGAAIGSAIGDGINKAIGDSEEVLANRVREILFEAAYSGIKDGIEQGAKDSVIKQQEKEFLDFGNKLTVAYAASIGEFGKLLTSTDFMKDAATKFFSFAFDVDEEEVRKGFDEIEKLVNTEAYKKSGIKEKGLAFLLKFPGITKAPVVRDIFGFDEEDSKKLQEYGRSLDISGFTDLSKPFDEAAARVQLLNSGIRVTTEELNIVNNLQEEYRKQIEEAYASGEITYKEYRDSLEKIARFQAVLIPLTKDLSGATLDVNGNIEDTEEVYRRLANIFINGTKEEIDLVLQLALAYRKLRLEGKNVEAEELEQDINRTLDAIELNISRRELKLPVYMDMSELSSDEVDLLMQEIAKLQEEYIRTAVREGLVADEQALRNYFNSIDPVIVKTKEGLMKAVGEGLDISKFKAEALRNLEEQGLIGGEDKNLNIRILDISSSQRGRLYTALERAARTLERFYPEYKMDVQPLGVIFKDNVTDILHVDMLQLQLALRELVELNRDQLDGIYNLPSDATFFVPWMAWELAANAALNQPPSQEQQQKETKILADEELKGLLDQDIRNGQEMLQYLNDILNETSQIKERQLTPEELKYFKLAEPKVTTMQHGSIFSSEQIEQLGEYLYSKLSRPERAAIDMQHGSVSNIDEGMKNYEKYLKSKEGQQQNKLQQGEDASISILERIANTLDVIKVNIERTFDFRDTNDFEIPVPQFNWQDFLDAFRSLDLKTDLNINLIQNVKLEVDGKVLYAQVMRYLYRDVLSRSKSSTVARINNLI